MKIKVDQVLDAKGLSCPMPIVKTKKAMDALDPGQVIEVRATDKGSTADIQAWAKSVGHQYLGTLKDGDVLKHYLRKASAKETKAEAKHPLTIDHRLLQEKIENQEEMTILDVREPAEYAFGHIPSAKHIPLGELANRLEEIDPHLPVYVICRSGHRSDLACQLLSEKGFKKVLNVIPGMSEWDGPVEK